MLALVDQALEQLGGAADPGHRVDADVHRARLMLERHLQAEARPIAEQVVAAARALDHPDRLADAGRTLMSCHHRHGEADEALVIGDALLVELDGRMSTEPHARLLALQGLLRLFHRRGDASQQARGLEEMQRAVALGGLTPAQEGDVLVYRSRVHDNASPERLELLQQALARYVAVGSYKGRGLCHHDLATVCQSRGDPLGALEHFRASARAFDRIGVNAFANARLGEGTVLVDLGRVDEGEPVLRWVRDRARRIGHRAWAWCAALGLFHAALQREDLDQARAWLDELEASEVEGLTAGEVPHDHIVALARASADPSLAERLHARLQAVLV